MSIPKWLNPPAFTYFKHETITVNVPVRRYPCSHFSMGIIILPVVNSPDLPTNHTKLQAKQRILIIQLWFLIKRV